MADGMFWGAETPADTTIPKGRGRQVDPENIWRSRAAVKRDLRRRRVAKRMLDVSVALAVAPVVLVTIVLAAIAIKLDDGGPIFFKQKRVGTGGRAFTMLKLRSMRPQSSGSEYTQQDDDRITRVGAVLRRYRIDELPQVYNVLRGEMAICGPRPETVALSTAYRAAIPYYRLRYWSPPGITGWAQINQGYAAGIEPAIEKLRYDLFYVRNASLLFDLWILLKTVRTLITGHGAR